MARMRTTKPEFWSDEDLANAASRDARMLYMGLWNLADEHGRLRGDPRYVKGQLFAYDDDLTPAVIDALLAELAAAGKVVRYRVAGSRYLFLPKLAEHQRLEPDKVPSRLPPPEAAEPEPDPPSGSRANESARRSDESAPNRTIDEHHNPQPVETDADLQEQARANLSAQNPDESALTRARLFKHVAGSREQVAGVPPSAERAALALVPRADESEPDPPDPEPPTTTQALIADWIDHSPKRPPGTVINQAGKHIKAMLAEGIDPADVRRGLAAWAQKGSNPSALPSFVNQVMNAANGRASPRRPGDIDWTAAMRRAEAREAAQ